MIIYTVHNGGGGSSIVLPVLRLLSVIKVLSDKAAAWTLWVEAATPVSFPAAGATTVSSGKVYSLANVIQNRN